jgi:thioredoxin reductase (NADPH)
MQIIDPTYGKPGSGTGQPAATAPDWRHDPMCLFSNSKPNADDLLRGIGPRLGAALGRGDIAFERKKNAAMPADPDMLDWLARQYRVVVLAVGD